MLKGNLSTRPFYNDRIVTVAIAVAAVLVVVASVVNISQLVRLSSERSAVRARLEADAREAARIRTEAEALQGQVDRVTLARLASSAREANQLIDQRTVFVDGPARATRGYIAARRQVDRHLTPGRAG